MSHNTSVPSQVIRQAIYKIKNENHWTRGRLAANANDKTVDPSSSIAVRWCAIGAACSVVGALNAEDPRLIPIIGWFREAIEEHPRCVGDWFDEHDHEDTVDVMKDAAALAEAAGQ